MPRSKSLGVVDQRILTRNSGKKIVKSSSFSGIDSVVFYVPVDSLGIPAITSPLVVDHIETCISKDTVAMGVENPQTMLPLDTAVSFQQGPPCPTTTSNADLVTSNTKSVTEIFVSDESLADIVVSSASSPQGTVTVSSPVVLKPQIKRSAEKHISTLVFFDLETTGLAHEIGKHNVQITEISMIAIKRKEFEDSTSSELKDIRIIQKLCLCVRPRSRISMGAAKVTGLNDYSLIDQHPFNSNAAAAITSFLNHLPKPVCLLAHNGAAYDFPLLKAEFKKLSIHLPSDILIADTLRAFRELGVPVFPAEKKVCKAVKFNKTGQVSYALANLHLYFFNKKPTGSHSSEGDCIALAKVCHRMKDVILPWLDENPLTMDIVTPMW